MALSSDTLRRRAQVVARDVDQGAVLIDMLDGRCFELNRVGGLFWSKLDVPRSIGQICEEVAPELPVPRETLERDLGGLADELLRAGLIERVILPSPDLR